MHENVKIKCERICIKYRKQPIKSFYRISAKEFVQYNLYLQSFKSSQWAFEKEIRAIDITIIKDSGYNQPINGFGLRITKIIAGYLSEYIEELQKIANQLGVSFSIMKPDFESNKFKLVEQKVI